VDHQPVSTVVAVVGSRVEAEMIVGMLHGHGIHATVSGDDGCSDSWWWIDATLVIYEREGPMRSG
jgi:hypothetical protein